MNVDKLMLGLAKKFGKSFHYCYKDVPSYSTVTGEVSGTSVERSVMGVVTEYSRYAFQNDIVRVGDKKILIPVPSLPKQPEIGEEFKIDNVYWVVVNITDKGLNEAAFYEIQVRRV